MEITPNAFAWFALAVWPVVGLALFAAGRGKSLARTTAWAIVLPIMLLPAALEFKVEGIPAVDKHRMTFLVIAVALELFHPRPFAERLRAHRFARIMSLALMLAFIGTVRTNGDALVFGPMVLPALTPWEVVTNAGHVFLDLYLPFAIGERVFSTPRDLRELLDVVSLSSVLLAPLIAVELLMSPQLHYWFYGYHQHAFLQHVRGSGYRPMLFMAHGLAVALYLFAGLLAAIALARTRTPGPRGGWLTVGVVGALLLVIRSLGAQVYAVVAVAVDALLSPRARARFVLVLVAFTLAYPVVRGANLLPREDILGFFDRIDAQRSDSLRFRFDWEEQLLARANQRPVFGWGGWSRSLIIAPWGQVVSVSDGAWIIELGQSGYVGLVIFFAVLAVPLLRWALRRENYEGNRLVATLALFLAFAMLDLLPNSRYDYLSVAGAGALFALTARRRRLAVPGAGPQRGWPAPRRAGAAGPMARPRAAMGVPPGNLGWR